MLRAVLGCLLVNPALVNRRRADAKILLHVGFGRRPAVQPRVEVNKRQILALLGVKVFAERLTPAIRFSCLSVPRTRRRYGSMYVIGSSSAKPSAPNSRRF